MSTKRKDNKGRVLRTGESQRKDGLYEYRYTDANKKRRSIYSADLMELRKKEDEIKVMTHEGIDYAGGEITVLELVERYTTIKRGVRYNTQTGYRFVLSVLKKQIFGQRKIRDIKMSDAKLWIIDLFDQGYSYSTIASIRGVVKPAFQMAYTEDIVRRNPFDFRLDIIPNNTQKRVALTEKQQKDYLNYIAQDKHYSRYLDEIIILLGTGMRISELCGLTMSDLDFERRRIRVDHQLVRTRDGKRYIEKTKTESGCRCVIQLPANLFFGTTIATCIMVLKRGKKDNKTLFIDATNECIKVTNNNKLTNDNIDRIVEIYTNRESIDHISYLASFEEIEEKDFNLLISSYVVAEDKKKDVDIEKINTRVAELTKKVNMLRLEVDDIVAEIRRAQDE